MRTSFLAFACMGITLGSIAQQETDNSRKYELKVTTGMVNRVAFNHSDSKLNEIAKELIVPDSFQRSNPYFYNSGFYSGGAGNYLMLSFSFDNNFFKTKKINTSTAIHLGFGSSLYSEAAWGYRTSSIIDTLTSSSTGTNYFVEEELSRTYNRYYHSRSINLGIGQRISTNPERIFKFETGIDLIYFMSFNARQYSSYYEYPSYINKLSSNNTNTQFGSTSVNKELGAGKGDFVSGMTFRVPLDFSFRLSKSKAVWKDMRLGGELNYGINTLLGKKEYIINDIHISGGINFRYKF